MTWPLAVLWILALAVGTWEIRVWSSSRAMRREQHAQFEQGYSAGYDAAIEHITKGAKLAKQDASENGSGPLPVQGA